MEKGIFYFPDSDQSGRKEIEPRYELKAKVLITGFPGTGKTKLISSIGEKLHLERRQIVKIGNKLRQEYKNQSGVSSTGYISRNQSVDQKLDDITSQMILDPNEQPFFLEAQLAGLVAFEKIGEPEKRAQMSPKVITVLLKCEERERMQRVWKRDRQENPSLSQEDSYLETCEREQQDLEQWKKTHPIISKENIDPRNPAEEWQKKLYDVIIDTSGKPVTEVEIELIEKLISLHAVDVVTK